MKLFYKISRFLNIPDFINNVEGFTRTKTEEIKVRFEEYAMELLAKIAIYIAMFFVSLFFLLFASITAGQYFNEVLDSTFAGHGIMALFYLLLLIILFLIKKLKTEGATSEDVSKNTSTFHD